MRKVTIVEEGRELVSTKLVRRVSGWLRTGGFEICQDNGLAREDTDCPHYFGVGIIVPSKTIPRLLWGNIWDDLFHYGKLKTKRRMFAGLLIVNDNHRGAHPSKQWFLEVYGEEALGLLKPVSEQMTVEFNVDIHMRVVDDEPRWEWFHGERGCGAD